MKKIWIRLWKTTEEITIDTFELIEVDPSKEQSFLDDYAQSWAINTGYAQPPDEFDYGWEQKDPPKTWLESQIRHAQMKIDSVTEKKELFEAQLKLMSK